MIPTCDIRQGNGMGSHQSTVMKTDVWLTPPEILKALGQFDLDPCAPEVRPWDTGKNHYSLPWDGLAMPWTGRVWLNPPYSSHIGPWLQKLKIHGNGIALVFARTETTWFFDHVWNGADGLLFIQSRLHFYSVNGKRAPANAGAPSCLIAYGSENATALVNSGIKGTFMDRWFV